MHLPDDSLSYLLGEKYTNALSIPFIFDDLDFRYRTQIDILCEIAAGKKIIHLGCVDHNIDTVKHKMKRKKWLHARLCEKAERCFGIDIEEEGIRYMQEGLGYSDSACVDIFSEEFEALALSDDWDFLFIPEVLEHIEAPLAFLARIAEKYRKRFDKLVLTVPNGLSRDNYLLAKQGREVINSDHRFWFSAYTLAKCVAGAGFDLEEIRMCRHGTINWRAFRRNRFYRKYPLLRNDILCQARFR